MLNYMLAKFFISLANFCISFSLMSGRQAMPTTVAATTAYHHTLLELWRLYWSSGDHPTFPEPPIITLFDCFIYLYMYICIYGKLACLYIYTHTHIHKCMCMHLDKIKNNKKKFPWGGGGCWQHLGGFVLGWLGVRVRWGGGCAVVVSFLWKGYIFLKKK